MSERISYTQEQLDFIAHKLDLRVVDQISSRRGSVVIARQGKVDLAVKIADKTLQATEIDITPPRSVGITNEARILKKLPEGIGPQLVAFEDSADLTYIATKLFWTDTNQQTQLTDLSIPQLGLNSITKVIAKLHQVGIFHGDIQPGNVVFFFSHEGQLETRLVDFELAREKNCPETVYPGLYHYLTPESAEKILKGEAITIGAEEEFFALTASLLSMLTNRVAPSYSSTDLTRKDKLAEIAFNGRYCTVGVSPSQINLAQALQNILQLPRKDRPKDPDTFLEAVNYYIKREAKIPPSIFAMQLAPSL